MAPPPAAHPAGLPETELLAGCEIRRGRRSGPGGQHRNKVETAIVIKHTASGVTAEATERRSQEQNRRVAIFRLRVNLALNQRRPPAAEPSDRWKSRCRARRVYISRQHEDFPALLAESLDVIVAKHGDAKAAAEWLDCSPTQLTKLLKLEPRALRQVNELRATLDLHPLQ